MLFFSAKVVLYLISLSIIENLAEKLNNFTGDEDLEYFGDV